MNRTPNIERFIEFRKALNLSQQKLADKLGIKKNRITDTETGKQKLQIDIVLKMEEEFNLNRNWLETGKGSTTIVKAPTLQDRITNDIKLICECESNHFTDVPFFPQGIPCGNCNIVFDDIKEYKKLPIEQAKGADFLVRANGDSMVNEGIVDGSLLYVKKQDYLSNNNHIMLINHLDNGMACRRVCFDYEKQEYELHPGNQKYNTEIVKLDSIQFIGRVIKVEKDF